MALVTLLIAIWLGIVAWRRRIEAVQPWKPIAWLSCSGLLLAVVLLLIDFESQKLAIHLLSPLSIAWLILFAVVLAALRERQWSRAAVVGGCWLLLTLGGNVWIGTWLLGRLEASVPPVSPQARWDAVVVLSGGTALDAQDRSQLGDAGDRLRVGALLFHDQRTPLLITTGSGLFAHDGERNLAVETAAIWTSMGVPATAVLEAPGPVNTAQEIVTVAKLASIHGWKRIGLVTSAWHLRRALALAHTHNLVVDGIPADVRGRQQPFSPACLVPSGMGFQYMQLWLTEVVGRMVGR